MKMRVQKTTARRTKGRRMPVLFFLLAAMLLAVLTGCGGKEKETAAAAEPKTPQEMYDLIEKNIGLPEMVPGDDDYIFNYYGIDTKELDSYVFATADSAVSADAVIILKAKDAASAGAFAEKLKSVKEWKEAEMENYAPEAYKVAKASEVRTEGQYVWLIMSEKASEMEEIVRNGIKGKP